MCSIVHPTCKLHMPSNLSNKAHQITKLRSFLSRLAVFFAQLKLGDISRGWRCSWSSADRQCSNYIWVINNYIAYLCTTYIGGLMLVLRLTPNREHSCGWTVTHSCHSASIPVILPGMCDSLHQCVQDMILRFCDGNRVIFPTRDYFCVLT